MKISKVTKCDLRDLKLNSCVFLFEGGHIMANL